MSSLADPTNRKGCSRFFYRLCASGQSPNRGGSGTCPRGYNEVLRGPKPGYITIAETGYEPLDHSALHFRRLMGLQARLASTQTSTQPISCTSLASPLSPPLESSFQVKDHLITLWGIPTTVQQSRERLVAPGPPHRASAYADDQTMFQVKSKQIHVVITPCVRKVGATPTGNHSPSLRLVGAVLQYLSIIRRIAAANLE